MSTKTHTHAEPVPMTTQLLVLPFLASVYGYLTASKSVADLRVTMHRVMTQRGTTYLQQICSYVDVCGYSSEANIGRVFSVDTGIIGASFDTGKIWRTKKFESKRKLVERLQQDMKNTEDFRRIEDVALEYLSVPFLSAEGEVVSILYADCKEFDILSNDQRINAVTDMCRGYALFLDALASGKSTTLENFDLRRGEYMKSQNTLYPNMHEALHEIDPPELKHLKTLNFEAAP